jgi:hypothetical protein
MWACALVMEKRVMMRGEIEGSNNVEDAIAA